MRVLQKRWGEVTIKKQGKKKNDFDKTKSFSIENVGYEYSIYEYWEILKLVTDLSQKMKYKKLRYLLGGLR